MHLTENLNILFKYFPDAERRIKYIGKAEGSSEIILETSRNGMPVLIYEGTSGPVYLHSKYDPVTEAERLIGQYKNVDRYKHVFFYGLGMGYHVEEFCRRWPDKSFTVYEPIERVLLYYLTERQLKELPLSKCRGFFTGSSQEDMENIFQQFADEIDGEVLFVVLPSYERLFGGSYKSFMETFRTAAVRKIESLYTRTCFQKLWTRNSIINFKEVISSSNMLQEKKKFFAGKPAIIAAAGPSLDEELENLRLIRDKGLAYIFSVGSAVNTLISNGIPPHGICIYDPGANTNEVIRIVKERGLEIPLIFGSSVYSGAVQEYPGCKLHILTSQDTVSYYFLKHRDGEELHAVIDAPSIAIIALQMLVMLGCAPIILVGQNFAFKDGRYYARSIEYNGRPGELCNSDLDNFLETEDVHGGRVLTSRLFNHMRNQMEMYISHTGCRDIVNATRDGARIEGTRYKPLAALLEKELVNSVVDENWLESIDFTYDLDYMTARGKLMLQEREAAERLLEEIVNDMEIFRTEYSDKLLLKALNSFEQAYNKLVKNHFFNYILRPMNRVQFEKILKNIPGISSSRHTAEKARYIAEIFGDVFDACIKDMNEIKYDFYDMLEEIMEYDIKLMSFTVIAS